MRNRQKLNADGKEELFAQGENLLLASAEAIQTVASKNSLEMGKE